MSIIVAIPRIERHLMQKTIHKTHDQNHASRLMLHWSDRTNAVAQTLCYARSSVNRWIDKYPGKGAHSLLEIFLNTDYVSQ